MQLVAFYFSELKNDLANHSKGAGFLTLVAGSAVLGTGYAQSAQQFGIATVLLVFAFIVWLILVYSFLCLTMLKKEKPSPEDGMDGSWLLLIVSTQSLVILTSTLAPHLQMPLPVILFISIAAWLAGLLLYIVFVTLIIYRLIFYRVDAPGLNQLTG